MTHPTDSDPGKDTSGAPFPLLTLACLFEGPFSIDWIMELTDMKPSRILAEAEEGIRREWLTQTGPGRFTFTDPKKRKDLQATLSDRKKKDLHRRIAGILLKELPDGNVETRILAGHLLHITNDETGCRWLLLASQAYLKNFQRGKALACYTKIHEDLSRLKGKEADELFIQTAVKYSKISTGKQDTTKVIEILEEAMKRARKGNDLASQALIQMHLAKNQWLLDRYERALTLFKSGWSKAQKCGDPRLLRSATTFSTFFLYWQGRFKEVLAHYEKTVSEVENYPKSDFPLLAAATVGLCYAHVGQVAHGLGMADAIKASCLERGDLYSAQYAEGTIGLIMLSIRPVDEAMAYLERGLTGTDREYTGYARLLAEAALAYAHYLMGDTRLAMKYLRKHLRHCRDVNVNTLNHIPFLLELSWAMDQGKLPRIEGLSLERELSAIIKGRNVFIKGLAYRYRAWVQKKDNAPPETVLASLNLSLQWLEESGHQVELARTRLEIARQHLIQGEEEKAREFTRQAAGVLSLHHENMVPDDLRALLKEIPDHETLLQEILKLGQELVTMRSSRDLVHQIISTVNRITGAERGAIFLLEDDSAPPRLRLRASRNLTFEQVSRPDFAPSMELIRKAAGNDGGQPVSIIAPQGKGTYPDLPPCKTIRSRICVPMIFKEKVKGVLYHDNRLLSSAFRESDLETLSFFAAQAAIALDNASAYEEIQRLNQKLREEKLYWKELQPDHDRFQEIVGESRVIQKMLGQIEQVAGTDTTVLILGETGVGKELVANAIHRNSPRHARPFIRANCSALTESLINSELFGHEKGAFTGASSRRAGRFELADTGTIFLDEIGDLPVDVQVSLLRVIQTKEFERVGGSETLRSDFRLVAATNRHLEDAIRKGRFRSDLYYRLNVFPIHVPPLRERKEDIPLLARYFIGLYGKKSNKPIERIPESEINTLVRYHWPGNVRELENVIERGIILSNSTSFRVPELGGPDVDLESGRKAVSLKENERNHILWALDRTGWKVRGAGGTAELLDIHPSTLAFRMNKLDIQRPPKYSRGKQKKNLG